MTPLRDKPRTPRLPTLRARVPSALPVPGDGAVPGSQRMLRRLEARTAKLELRNQQLIELCGQF